MRDKVLVTGATGHVGSELVGVLLDAGVDVKAGTRTPSRARTRFGSRVEPVELDYDITETWDAAVEWADRVFLVPPPFDPRGDERLVPFLDWAVQSGATHIVLLSAMGVETREMLALRKIEQRIEQTGVAWTFLRPNIYMQNFARGFIARDIRDDGVFRLPVDAAPVSFVDGRDVAAVAAAALTSDGHYGQEYTLTGPTALTHDDVASAISTAAGRQIRYQPVSEEEMRQALHAEGWPADQADTFAALLASIREGQREPVTDHVERVLGRAPAALEDFVRAYADSWS